MNSECGTETTTETDDDGERSFRPENIESDCLDSEDERKRQRRLDANRRSAQKSRYRKLVLLNELQQSVSEMTSAHALLSEENGALRDQLAIISQLYECGEPYSGD
eukprot:8202362-Ditylum_brightwellii.AAC.1